MKNLSDEQRAGLRGLASRIHAGVAAKDLHDPVYTVPKESGISASKMFQAIYISILGKRSGPRAGYFMVPWIESFCWIGCGRLAARAGGG